MKIFILDWHMKKLFTVFVLLLITYKGFSQTNYVSNVEVSLFAGNYQNADGQGTIARFYLPQAVAVDASGNFYVADSYGLIRKISSTGLVSTLAGSNVSGSSDGQGTAASFNQPSGIAVDKSGNIYVADVGNNEIRKITAGGLVSTFAGSTASGIADGQGILARFNAPSGIAVDDSGNVYVADTGGNRIRKITPGGLVRTLAGSWITSGSTDGQGIAATFNGPYGLTVDISGNVYVADRENNMIRKITPGGLVSTIAGSTTAGSANGQGIAASFRAPCGIAVDASGNIYVGDYLNNEIRKITSSGLVSTFAGSITKGSLDGQGQSASFYWPAGLASDAAGNVYIADSQNSEIRKITSGGLVSTIAGTAINTNGQGISACFDLPTGIAIDGSGNLYITDFGSDVIRKITKGGLVTTLAGSGASGSNDGQGIAASFFAPSAIAVDASGNLYVADTDNNMIRKITPGGLVSTLAGSKTSGNTNGQGTQASFNTPKGIAVDASGNVYVADTNNELIRKITPGGLVSTLAGSGSSGSTDGQGTAASFWYPRGVALDAFGNLFVADYGSIRKITPGGLVSTFAGGGGATINSDGQGINSSFDVPFGIAVDASNNVYVADQDNNEIRIINSSGLVNTLAGSITAGHLDGQGMVASFNQPSGVAVDDSGNVFVADYYNFVIKKLTIGNTTTATIKDINASAISVFPNPAKDLLNINLSEVVNGTLSISDIQGSLVLMQPVNGKQVQLSTASLQDGFIY